MLIKNSWRYYLFKGDNLSLSNEMVSECVVSDYFSIRRCRKKAEEITVQEKNSFQEKMR